MAEDFAAERHVVRIGLNKMCEGVGSQECFCEHVGRRVKPNILNGPQPCADGFEKQGRAASRVANP